MIQAKKLQLDDCVIFLKDVSAGGAAEDRVSGIERLSFRDVVYLRGQNNPAGLPFVAFCGVALSYAAYDQRQAMSKWHRL